MKKLTKLATIFMAGTMMLSLAACGSSTSDAEETVNPVDKINIVNKDGQIVSGPALATEAPEEESTENWRTLIPSTENVNLDDGTFTINSVTYTVGETTLQDMIDAGAPFDDESLAEADKNFEEHNSYRFDVGLDHNIYGELSCVSFRINDDVTSAEECKITKVYISLIPDTPDTNYDPFTEDYIQYSYTIDGITYEPSVMSKQDVFDKLGDYAHDSWSNYSAPLEPDTHGYGFYVKKSTEYDSYHTEAEVGLYTWNDTGAVADPLNCLAECVYIQFDEYWNN